mmetsp:Transcript_36815/g.105220  ORF Transcript_36815/g.105220 Transcript_36815/m.105220 type:complete len:293 (-) Transcript_36815:58-936(-)
MRGLLAALHAAAVARAVVIAPDLSGPVARHLQMSRMAWLQTGRLRRMRPRIFIGIKSAPKQEYRERRNKLRQRCLSAYKEAGLGYAFFVGVPTDPGHDLTTHRQDTVDTPSEREEEERLLNESTALGDMQFLMFRDQYLDLPNKLLGLLRYGYLEAQAAYVMEHDDDMCANVPELLEVIRKHEAEHADQELWAGRCLFQGTEYPVMKGATGMIAKYFSGHGSVLSRGLLRYVVSQDLPRNVLGGFYGTNMDDASLGKWVKHAEEAYRVQIQWVMHPQIIWDPFRNVSKAITP